MRLDLLIFFLTVPFFINAQDRDIKQNDKFSKISNHKKTNLERLQLLDSLANNIRYDSPSNSDSIFRATISYAYQMDSIHMAMKHTTNFINYLNYGKEDFKEAQKIIKATYPSLKKVTKPNIIDDFYYEAAYVYFESRNFDDAVKHFDSAYAYAKKYNSKYMELSKFGIGMAQINNGKFGEASLELQKAAVLFRRKKDTIMWLNVKNSISVLYSKNGFFEEAKKERNELIAIAKISNTFPNLSVIYYNSATDDNKINSQKNRIKNLKLAIAANNSSNEKHYYETIFKSGLIAALAENDSLKHAKALLNELELKEENITGSNAHYYLNGKMRFALADKDYANALKYGTRYYDLKNEGDQYEEIQEAEHFLSEVYQGLGDKDKALLHFKNYTKIKDSIGSVQKTNALAYYQTIYETEKRDLTIQNQNNNIALLDTKNKLQNQWMVFGGLGLLAGFVIVTSVRSRNYAKRKQKSQEVFTQGIINTQEQERTRIALELHDSVGQQLMLLTRQLKTMDNLSFGILAQDTLENVRAISQGLYPAALERLGFTAAVEELINELDEKTDVFFTSSLENTDALLTKEKALHLYRILQEALNNVLKHAEAKAVAISIKVDAQMLLMIIKDNGKGFEYHKALSTSKSLGMKSLKERCNIILAQFEVISVINKETQIIVKLPVISA